MARSPSKRRPASLNGAGGRAVAVGLTGGIGAGKSTALSMFRELGAIALSADAIVHSLYSSTELKSVLVDRFGPVILDGRGEIDRGRLREAVRGDKAALEWLERSTHPRVAAEIERALREAPSGAVVVCEVPLLFEAGYEDRFDLVVTVEASPSVRWDRSAHRFDPEDFSEFDALQAGTKKRTEGSDLVFYNEGTLDHMRDFVMDAYQRALSLAEKGL